MLPDNANEKGVTWSSGTTSVADINSTSGAITIKGGGSTTIKATAKDGSGKYGTKTLTVGFTNNIIGVVDTGGRSASGATLAWIDENFNVLSSVPTSFFDNHPSWNFEHTLFGTNHFRKIPIAYWKRGTVPSGKTYAGKWYMMLSPTARSGFTANPAFMYKGSQKNAFYWGTYRSFNNSGKPGSQPNKSHWKSVSWQAFWNAAVSLGDGYHMGSFQEYHEILARAVIEKKTFNLWPVNVRKNYAANEYRGIQEMAYDRYTDDNTNGTLAEWRSGVQTDANKNLIVFDTSGNWTYVNSGKAPQVNGYIGTLLTGQYFDHMFFAETGVSSIDTSMIPDYNYTARATCVGYSNFNSDYALSGAFYSDFSYSSSYSSGGIGSRLAYIK